MKPYRARDGKKGKLISQTRGAESTASASQEKEREEISPKENAGPRSFRKLRSPVQRMKEGSEMYSALKGRGTFSKKKEGDWAEGLKARIKRTRKWTGKDGKASEYIPRGGDAGTTQRRHTEQHWGGNQTGQRKTLRKENNSQLGRCAG